ncbi:MAG: SH3 domain-containing protein [bacterium]|nr:SH3 domain-containing protein [bacterium]
MKLLRIVFICLFVMSCKEKEINLDDIKENVSSTINENTEIGEKTNETIEAEEPIWEKATVTHNNLNMRKEPELDSIIIHSLMKGTILEVVDRSDSKTEINGEKEFWYQVKLDAAYIKTGWVFGSFIKEYEESPNTESYIKNHEMLDPSQFPDEKMNIFGIEPPYSLPQNGLLVEYDDMNSLVFFSINDPQNIPESILVEAVEPDGDKHYQYYNHEYMNKFEVVDYDEWTQEEFNPPFLGFRFYNTAAFFHGEWTFNITTDKNEKYNYDILIGNDTFMFCKIVNPDPFNFNGWTSVNPGDNLYLFGDLDQKNISFKLVLYYITDEQYDDQSFKLVPKLATEIVTDQNGRFMIEIIMGEDMPFGQYKIAYGKKTIKLVKWDVGFSFYE